MSFKCYLSVCCYFPNYCAWMNLLNLQIFLILFSFYYYFEFDYLFLNVQEQNICDMENGIFLCMYFIKNSHIKLQRKIIRILSNGNLLCNETIFLFSEKWHYSFENSGIFLICGKVWCQLRDEMGREMQASRKYCFPVC